MNAQSRFYLGIMLAVAGCWLLAAPRSVSAHCDTMDGPVVADARAALAKNEITPVLKWVKLEQENEVREAFERTLAVRKQSPEAKELADTYFFETLVRLHRAGEGAPFTGLKPSGSLGPAIVAADEALESGSIDPLGAEIASEVAAAVRTKFAVAFEAKKHASKSVEAGRAYAAAYVEYVHFIEALHGIVSGAPVHGEEESQGEVHR